MKVFLLFWILFFSFIRSSYAQCTGLQIIGFNSDNPDQIALGVTSAIAGNVTYYITDNEWNGSTFNSGEQIITWITPSTGIASGSIVLLDGTTATCGTLSGVPQMAVDGEEIYITSVHPSGTVAASNICFGVIFGGTGSIAGITGVNVGNFDNAVYNSGDITNSTNWTTSNSIITLPSGTCTLLPIELKRFNGASSKNHIILFWETGVEWENSHFEIEKKQTNSQFEKIGIVLGNGTTIQSVYYYFEDKLPKVGVNYYRLKQVDFDGNYSYSPVISVNFHPENQISLHPNPLSGNELTLLLPGEYLEENFHLQIYSHTGQHIKTITTEPEPELQLDLSDLLPGAYFLKVIADARVETLKFLRR